MQKLVSVLRQELRTLPRTESVHSFLRNGNRRMESMLPRTFATKAMPKAQSLEIVARSNGRRLFAFSSGAALSFGGLIAAGFMGFGSNPMDSRDMSGLKKSLEGIRKNYPNLRTFPVLILC